MDSYTSRADMLKHIKPSKFDQVSKPLLLNRFFVKFVSCVSSSRDQAGCIPDHALLPGQEKARLTSVQSTFSVWQIEEQKEPMCIMSGTVALHEYWDLPTYRPQ